MKLNMKKSICAVLIGCMTIGMCSCTKKNGDSSTITWYMQKPADNMSDQKLVEEAANKVIEKEIGTKLEFHFFDSAAYNDKMSVMIASGENFDICMTTSWTNDFLSNVKKGAFLEITDLLDKYGKDILKKTDENVLKNFKVNGGIYGVKSQSPLSVTRSRVFKKELVDKYNFDYKKADTLENLEPYLKLIKENEPGITPILVTGSAPIDDVLSDRYTDDSINGLFFDEETETYENIFDIPLYINRYRIYNDFYKKGYIKSNAPTVTETMSEAKSGNYAVMGCTGNYDENGKKSSATYGFPCVETYLGQSVIGTGNLFDGINAISITSKKPEKAIELLNLIWKDTDLSNTLAYGIEGVNYTVNKERSAEIGEKSVTPKSGSEQTWAIWHNWIGPLWDQWDSPWNSKEALENFQAINKSAEVSKSLGFVFDTTPVKSECAQVNSVMKELKPILNTGSMPNFDDYIKKCKEKLKASGIDKIKAEANKQYKEWSKTR